MAELRKLEAFCQRVGVQLEAVETEFKNGINICALKLEYNGHNLTGVGTSLTKADAKRRAAARMYELNGLLIESWAEENLTIEERVAALEKTVYKK